MCLLGGWLIGYAQGLISLNEPIGNIIVGIAAGNPALGTLVGSYVAGFVAQKLDPDYGSYWVFGVLLIVFGFLLVSISRKPPPIPEPPLLQS
jgi:uncharacterized membrane protein YfcA